MRLRELPAWLAPYTAWRQISAQSFRLLVGKHGKVWESMGKHAKWCKCCEVTWDPKRLEKCRSHTFKKRSSIKFVLDPRLANIKIGQPWIKTFGLFGAFKIIVPPCHCNCTWIGVGCWYPCFRIAWTAWAMIKQMQGQGENYLWLQ